MSEGAVRVDDRCQACCRAARSTLAAAMPHIDLLIRAARPATLPTHCAGLETTGSPTATKPSTMQWIIYAIAPVRGAAIFVHRHSIDTAQRR